MKIIKPTPITGLPTGVNGAHLWWRVNITANNGDSGYVALEQITMASVAGGANLCTGGVASGPPPGQPSYPPAYAFDTASYTPWVSYGGPTGWVAYRFLSPVNVVEYKIKARSDGYATQAPKDWKLQYSDDGSVWTDAGTVTGQTAWGSAEVRTFQSSPPSQIVTSNLTESDYTAWNSGTTYSVGDRCIRTSTHRIYECLVGNTNAVPETNLTGLTPKWLEVSATNMYKAFDSKIADQTICLDHISYTLATGIIDSIAILNMDATGVSVAMTDPVEGVVYSKTIDLVSTTNVVDAYTYCFSPIIRKTDLALMDLPPYINGAVSITITKTGDTAKCGEIVVGQQAYLGGTEYGLSVSDIDYSKKDTDTFGNFVVVERPFSNKMSCNLFMDNGLVDETKRLLSLYRSKPVVWVSVEDLSLGIVYGYRKSFEIVIPYPNNSTCSLEVEGLT